MGDGWFVVAGGVMAGVVVWRSRGAAPVLCSLLGVLVAGIGIADLNSIKSKGELVEPAWGIYAVIAGGAILVLSGFVLWQEKRRG